MTAFVSALRDYTCNRILSPLNQKETWLKAVVVATAVFAVLALYAHLTYSGCRPLERQTNMAFVCNPTPGELPHYVIGEPLSEGDFPPPSNTTSNLLEAAGIHLQPSDTVLTGQLHTFTPFVLNAGEEDMFAHASQFCGGDDNVLSYVKNYVSVSAMYLAHCAIGPITRALTPYFSTMAAVAGTAALLFLGYASCASPKRPAATQRNATPYPATNSPLPGSGTGRQRRSSIVPNPSSGKPTSRTDHPAAGTGIISQSAQRSSLGTPATATAGAWGSTRRGTLGLSHWGGDPENQSDEGASVSGPQRTARGRRGSGVGVKAFMGVSTPALLRIYGKWAPGVKNALEKANMLAETGRRATRQSVAALEKEKKAPKE